jgi:hypothetical protein
MQSAESIRATKNLLELTFKVQPVFIEFKQGATSSKSLPSICLQKSPALLLGGLQVAYWRSFRSSRSVARSSFVAGLCWPAVLSQWSTPKRASHSVLVEQQVDWPLAAAPSLAASAAPSFRYYIRVRAGNASGRGPASDEIVIHVS